MSVESEVAWVDMKGCAGFRFRNVPETSQQVLEKWLESQAVHELPSVPKSTPAVMELSGR